MVGDRVGAGLTGDDDAHLDGDLLATADEEQVGVLVLTGERVALDGLGQRQLLLAVEHDGQQGVRAAVAQGRGELAAGRDRWTTSWPCP